MLLYKNIAAPKQEIKNDSRPRGPGSFDLDASSYLQFDMGTEKGIPIKGRLLDPFHFEESIALVSDLNTAVSEWVVEMRLMQGSHVLEKITAARFSNLVAWPCLELTTEKSIANALFVAFLFFYDDRIDGTKQTLAYVKSLNRTLMASLERPTPEHEDSLIRSFSSFGMKARAAGIPLEGFSRAAKEYFLTAEVEVSEREDAATPNLITYMDRREISGAVYSVFELSAASYGIVLPEDLKGSKLFASMTQHAVRAICVANDLYSYRKECREGIPDNLVFIMQKSDDLDVSLALERTIGFHNTEIKCYLNHKALLLEGYPDSHDVLSRLCTLYEGWMSSNHAFSSTSRRYIFPST